MSKRTALIAIALVAVFASIGWPVIRSVQQNYQEFLNYRSGMAIAAQSKAWRDINVTDDLDTTDTIDFRFHREMCITPIAGTGSVTQVTIYVAVSPYLDDNVTPTPTSEFKRLYKDGSIVAPVAVSDSGFYVLPEAAFSAGAIRLVATTGTQKFQGNEKG